MLGLARRALVALTVLALCSPLVCAQSSSSSVVPTSTTSSAAASTATGGVRYVTYVGPDGKTVYLEDDRKPALYTQNWGECLQNNALDVTRFDAAYYQDNMTVLFHIGGTTPLNNVSIMMYIGVFAYGENRFELVFNPCNANIDSLCPTNSSEPIAASGIIPVSPTDVANIPNIAFSIPDFEGEAILRVFSNETEQEIGCYTAVVTNGASFSQPAAVGSVLGVFTVIALVASFATAIYGEAVPTMRLHYAHSMSVGVVFAVFHHIFFTGALSLNWPSVLVAWWSNFAWSGGMIYSASMQHSIDNLIGANVGNTTEVGAAEAGQTQYNLGGAFNINLIYRRALQWGSKHPLISNIASDIYRRDHQALPLRRDILQRTVERSLIARDAPLADAASGYTWYGYKVNPGLPLPGNFSGFAGTLSAEGIPVSHAFMTGFLWFLILFVVLVFAVVVLKWMLEALVVLRVVKQDRLRFFRDRWLGYTALVALRTMYIAFFMMTFLSVFQFAYDSSGGVKGVAAIVFIIFVVGIPGAAAYALYYKSRIVDARFDQKADGVERENVHSQRISWFAKRRSHPTTDSSAATKPTQVSERLDLDDFAAADATKEVKTMAQPFWTRMTSSGSVPIAEGELPPSIHDNEDFTQKFGWLASRFRRTRWWFFIFWIGYVFLEAMFYGASSSNGLAQVFGLLVIEVLACAFIVWARPFEGQRLNLLVVYCLGFSKITTIAISAAFDVQFNLNRIITTALGIIIIVIQGILTIITLIAITVGAASSYASVSRNREDFHPKRYAELREKYFDHLDRVVNDLPPEPKPKKNKKDSALQEKSGFEMMNVRRVPKVEDEDQVFSQEMQHPDGGEAHRLSFANDDRYNYGADGYRSANQTPSIRSRAASIYSTSQSHLPYGARPHRPSWSVKDFPMGAGTESDFNHLDMSRSMHDDDGISVADPGSRTHSRNPSRSGAPNRLSQRYSTDSLQMGGETSTRDSIGKVPAPGMRPRAGTYGSNRSNRSSGQFSIQPEIPDVALMPTTLQSRASGSYGGAGNHGRNYPLTPAQELEEWASPTAEPQNA